MADRDDRGRTGTESEPADVSDQPEPEYEPEAGSESESESGTEVSVASSHSDSVVRHTGTASASASASAAPPHPWELPIAALGAALLTAAAFPGLALWRGAPAYHDLATHHLPWRLWTAQQWLAGKLPLWNPLSANGFPMLAEPQAGALYPPNLLFGLIDPHAALNLVILGHVWLAALGAFLFARSLGLSRPGATVTGVGFGASGFLLTHVVYLPMLCGAAWIPLLMLAVDRYLRDARPRAALGAAGAAAMMVLAGHPQAAVLGALLAGSYAIARVAAGYGTDLPPRQRASRGIRLAAALLLGGLLCLPQLVATLELAGQSERAGGVDEAFAAQGALPPQEIVNIALPRTFGYERPADIPLAHHHHGELYWGNGETYWENAFFVGVPALLLALLAFVGGARRMRFFAVWAVVAPLLMLGPATPLFLLWRALPGGDLLRFPVRFALPLTLCLAVLAGGGLDAWLALARDGARRVRVTTWILVGGLLLAWAAAAVGSQLLDRRQGDLRGALVDYYENKLERWRGDFTDPPPGLDPTVMPPPPEGGEAPITVATLYDGEDYYGRKVDRILGEMEADLDPLGPRVLAPLGMALASLVLLVLAVRRPVLRWGLPALLAADLLAFGSGFNPAVPWERARGEPEMADHLTAVAEGGEAVRTAVVDRLVPLALDARMVGASDNLRHGLAEVSIPSPLRVQGQYGLVLEAGLGLEMLRPADRVVRVAARVDAVRALGVTHLQSVHELPAPYALMVDGEVKLYRVPAPWPRASLHGANPPPPGEGPLPRPSRGIPLLVDEPGHMELDLSGVGGGTAVVTETAYPGWKATVDDQPVTLSTAAGGLLALEVPAAAASATLRYRPTQLLYSLAAAPVLWALWLIWFIMVGAGGRGRRR